ncbi:MAG: hypothetical protein AB7E29_12190 [Xanthobacter sp.]
MSGKHRAREGNWLGWATERVPLTPRDALHLLRDIAGVILL